MEPKPHPPVKVTWRLMIPMLVYTVWHADSEAERKGAMDELLRLADVIDTYIGQLETLHDKLPEASEETTGIIPVSVREASLVQAAADIGSEPVTPQRGDARSALSEAAGIMKGLDRGH